MLFDDVVVLDSELRSECHSPKDIFENGFYPLLVQQINEIHDYYLLLYKSEVEL